MLSLIVTLFICLFSVCPINNKIDQKENDIVFNVSYSDKEMISDDTNLSYSPNPKNAFYDSDGNYTEYVVTFGDILNTASFLDVLDFFRRNGFDVYNMVEGSTIHTLPIQSCYMGDFDNFDYAGGYPFGISEDWLVNYVKLIKISTLPSGLVMYGVAFLPSYTDNINTNFLFRYCITPDFDYVVSSYITYQGNDYSSSAYNKCFVGSTYEQNPSIAYFLDVFSSMINRNTSPDYMDGYNRGYDAGYNGGYGRGYASGYNDGISTDATASTIFTGVLDVALIPVNVFLTIFNFEVFGINISGIVSALLTVSVVVIILRFILGGKDNDK